MHRAWPGRAASWVAAAVALLSGLATASGAELRAPRIEGLDRLSAETYELRPLAQPDERHSQVYVYADIGLTRDETARLNELASLFESDIYPGYVKRITPDPRDGRDTRPIVLLFDRFKDRYPAKYSRPLARATGRDVLLINLDELDPVVAKYSLVHELQHLFRSYYSECEASWLNEGLSLFAEYFYFQNFRSFRLEDFLRSPMPRLDFAYETPETLAYFGDFFFVYYLFRHYGGIDVVRKLMTTPETGLTAIDSVLAEQAPGAAPDLRAYYAFRPALLNYLIALAANPFSPFMESDGFFDLRVSGEPGVLARAGVGGETLTGPASIRLEPRSARYLRPDKNCVDWSRLADSPGFEAYLLDPSAPEAQLVTVAAPRGSTLAGRACFTGKDPTGRFMILVNRSDRIVSARVSPTD